MNETPLNPESKLLDAVRAIEHSSRRMTVVVNAERQILGTLTDGDVRRHLLARGSLEDLAMKAMNPNPITATQGTASELLIDLMRIHNVVAIPIVSKDLTYCDLIHLRDLSFQDSEDLPASSDFDFAVIMAGGEGARLKPLTNKTPKPMLELGGVPLLERQITRLREAGIHNIYIAVNYLGNVIEEYFKDGSSFNVKIEYIREKKKYGTAGALSLLPVRPTKPILVMNGDVYTSINFEALSTFHISESAFATVAAVGYTVRIPYGVIRTTGSHVSKIMEKPSEYFLCNAGIYVLSPNALERIPQQREFNMTDFLILCIDENLPVSVFPIHEVWADIGTPDELDKARNDFIRTERA